MQYFIYQLVDPRDKLPHYIGSTRDVDRRLYQHIRGDGSGNVLKDAWLEELVSLGLEPTLQEIEVVEGTLQDAVERELDWIRFFAEKEAPLTNLPGMPRLERTKMGYAVRDDLIKACKRIALETDRHAYEVVEDALQRYIEAYNEQEKTK